MRSPTRLRVFFTGPITSGGTLLTRYVVASVDGVGTDPTVLAAFALPDGAVELVLSDALVGGGQYTLNVAAGVVSGAETSPDVQLTFFVGEPPQAPSLQVAHTDVLAQVYGEDIAWDGSDWTETAEGDLQGVSGPDNAESAILRRLTSEGVEWDDSYGLKSRKYVDGPEGELPTLVALAERQVLADDRVVEAAATLLGPDANDPVMQLISIDVLLVGGVRRTWTTGVRSA